MKRNERKRGKEIRKALLGAFRKCGHHHEFSFSSKHHKLWDFGSYRSKRIEKY